MGIFRKHTEKKIKAKYSHKDDPLSGYFSSENQINSYAYQNNYKVSTMRPVTLESAIEMGWNFYCEFYPKYIEDYKKDYGYVTRT